MNDNMSMKRALIMQSFMPLFLILLVKYFDIKLLYLCKSFFGNFVKMPREVIIKTVTHPFFITFLLEIFCFLWISCSIISIKKFIESQKANFISEGESLVDVKKMSDSGVTFFMTYVLPMAMDDLDTLKGIIVFGILMIMLFLLMWKTNLFYQNPVLVLLGYEVFSFKFDTTQVDEYRGKVCIGITRGIAVESGYSIKRQKISDNVFLVYKDS